MVDHMAIEQQMTAYGFGKLNVIFYQKKSHKWMAFFMLGVRFVSGFCYQIPTLVRVADICQLGGNYDDFKIGPKSPI